MMEQLKTGISKDGAFVVSKRPVNGSIVLAYDEFVDLIRYILSEDRFKK